MKVYLDNAATTPISKEVFEAMTPFFMEKFGNPSSIHGYGRECKAAIERSRKIIAEGLNVSMGEIFFTSGGTETANMIIHGAIKNLRIKEVVTTRIEHHCVLYPLEELESSGAIKVHYLDLDSKGNIDIDTFEQTLSKIQDPVLVCLMHANNEIGTMLDINNVADICQNHSALFFSDTVQTVAHYPLDLQEIQVDFISGSAHKFHGPKGVGFAFIRDTHSIPPLIRGGSQERNMRAGTENVAGIVGLGEAFKMAYESRDSHEKEILSIKQYFHNKLKASIPDIEVNGNYEDNSLNTVLSVSFPINERSEFLVYNLDIENIAVSAGSACTSGSAKGSHVMEALNLNPQRTSIRFSFSRYSTKEEADHVIERLETLLLVGA